jgi:hypothetical protein
MHMTVFDGDSRCHVGTCFLYPNEVVVFGISKQVTLRLSTSGRRRNRKEEEISLIG